MKYSNVRWAVSRPGKAATTPLAAALLAAGVLGLSSDARAQTGTWDPFGIHRSHNEQFDRTAAPTRRAARRAADAKLDDALRSKEPLLSEDTVYALSRAIHRYQKIVTNGGWRPIPKIKGRWLRHGIQDERVALLRRRLIVSGDLRRTKARNAWLFDDTVQGALKRFQVRHGIRPKGVVDNRTLRALNVSAEVRLGQLRLNLSRLRELLEHRAKLDADGKHRYVLVNAPAFELQAVSNGVVELSSKVIVGKPATQTPTVHAWIRGLNFYPYWRVPDSIANRALIPTVIKKPDYLIKERIRVLDKWGGNEIDPGSIDWRTAPQMNYKFRQDPGEWNALGLVRLDMPNEHIVYLHDTPHKKLFNSSGRAFSAGCVRVQRVFDLTKWIANAEPEWSEQRVDAVIAGGVPEDLRLQERVPVTFTYVTAWGRGNGEAHFRADIYGRDGVSVLLAANDNYEKLPTNRLSP